jgi:hypothetical protein
VYEVTREGHSVIVFCSSRKNTESLARLLGQVVPLLGPFFLHLPLSSSSFFFVFL